MFIYMEPNTEEFSKFQKEQRLSKEQMARMVGTSSNTIDRLFFGQRVTKETARLVCKKLKLNFNTCFPTETKVKPNNVEQVILKINFKNLIQKRNLSISQISKESSISLTTLYKLKNKKIKAIKIETALILSKYFDIPFNELCTIETLTKNSKNKLIAAGIIKDDDHKTDAEIKEKYWKEEINRTVEEASKEIHRIFKEEEETKDIETFSFKDVKKLYEYAKKLAHHAPIGSAWRALSDEEKEIFIAATNIVTSYENL